MTYVLAELHGGPVDGQVAQVPASSSGWPVRDVAFPAFVLDEATERFWWDSTHVGRRPGQGAHLSLPRLVTQLGGTGCAIRGV
jgi:hypothetical protein